MKIRAIRGFSRIRLFPGKKLKSSFVFIKWIDYMLNEEYKSRLTGHDRNGNLLEIICHILEGDIIIIFHAMNFRKAYQAVLNL
jgi:hypothetical protein